MNELEVSQGLQQQATGEELPYQINVANWTSSTPSAATVVAVDETTGETVTDTLFPTNTPSISTTYITLDNMEGLVKGHTYRIEVSFTVDTTTIHKFFFRRECPL